MMWWVANFLFPFFTGLYPQAMAIDKVPAGSMQWVIDRSSTLRVSGRSNMNTFSCEVSGYGGHDTLTVIPNESGGSVRLNGTLQVAVSQFNCHNKLITGDLRKTIKAKDHPVLKVRFLSLDRSPDRRQSLQVIKGWVEVELAGVKKVMQLAFEFGGNGTTINALHGEKIFCFTDFNLAPPVKMAGMVKIKDEFLVDFRLRLVLVSG